MKEKLRIVAHPVDLLELKEKNNLLQTSFWGNFKKSQGLHPLAVKYEWNGKEYQLLLMIRRIAKIFTLGYVAHGPILPENDENEYLKALAHELQGILPLGCLFIRFDLNKSVAYPALGEKISNWERPKLQKPFRKAPVDIQPPDTVVLPIDQSDDELLAQMHKKWRYNIKLSSKKGVTVREGNDDDLVKWYELYKETAIRDKISIHPFSYYKTLFDMSKENIYSNIDLRLWIAEHEGDFIAGNITIFMEKRATYLYGASSNNKRNLMATYALQWHAILAAKESGCIEYDFYGIPPINDEKHPLYGLYRFKTGFGGNIVHYSGCWDLVYGKLFYGITLIAEILRQWYYKKWKKRK